MIGIIYKLTIKAKYRMDGHKPFYIGQHWCQSVGDFLCRDYPYYGSGCVWGDFLNRLKKDYPKKWRYFIKREVLCTVTNNSQKTLNRLEEFWIKREKSHYSFRIGGCNVLWGSLIDFCPTKDPEVRKKISKSKKEWFRTHEAPWKGRRMPEEQKEYLRRIMTGREFSEETRKKISEHHHDVSGKNNPNYGKGDAIRGNRNPMKDPEVAKRNAELRRGKKRTPEQCKRISEGKKTEKIKINMKILFADFAISKYGGIIEYIAGMLKAFKSLGHEVDVAQMTPASTTQKAYEKKVQEFESGEHQRKIKFHSQAGGYEKDEVTGYWRNNYYGYFLPPSNRIGVYESNAVERWKELACKFDIILWNFMPTKSSAWDKKGVKFDFWWKFFDLPSSVKMVFVAHDAYFDIRASNISALKDKILFMACAHLAAYQCCSNIGIPRSLLLNPRYIEDDAKMPVRIMQKRTQDFFAAHMFKSMKNMDELIAAIPYVNMGLEEDEMFSVRIAGTGIEYNYMTSETKTKSCYMCTQKRDPDLSRKLDGKISLWNRALKYGMEYRGQMSGSDVLKTLRNTKFAIDPSWSEHYSKYCRTHINGFIIEAMLNGAYPVLRDYRGLSKDCDDIYDPLFENIKAVIIPWDATPKEFSKALQTAILTISPKQFLLDTKHNFELVTELFNSKRNAEEIIRLCKGGRKIIRKELSVGKDSDNVKKITSDIMEDFFGIELPIEWEN